LLLLAKIFISCRSAHGPIAAVRFNADYDHFYERNQRCFAKSE
jgi:hypothetical protein